MRNRVYAQGSIRLRHRHRLVHPQASHCRLSPSVSSIVVANQPHVISNKHLKHIFFKHHPRHVDPSSKVLLDSHDATRHGLFRTGHFHAEQHRTKQIPSTGKNTSPLPAPASKRPRQGTAPGTPRSDLFKTLSRYCRGERPTSWRNARLKVLMEEYPASFATSEIGT